MKYDFTSILNRDGMDAIAVNPPMNASWISFAPTLLSSARSTLLSDISAHVLNILNPLSTGIS